MSWSNEWPKPSKDWSEWKNSPGFAEKLDKAFENEWPKPQIRDLGAEAGMQPIRQTVGQLIAETVKPEDIVKGPTFDGNVWSVDSEWQEHIDINGGINPVALGWRANDIGDPIILPLIINDGDFPTQVGAMKIGDLAVHRNLRQEGYWQVTHVPTLTRFNAVPNGLHKQADLIAWCKKVQSQLPEDWKELAQLTQECYKERSAAKDRIMSLCQGMEVGYEAV